MNSQIQVSSNTLHFEFAMNSSMNFTNIFRYLVLIRFHPQNMGKSRISDATNGSFLK